MIFFYNERKVLYLHLPVVSTGMNYQGQAQAMRAVLQRVKQASVSVAGTTVGEIGKGFLVLLGVGKQDTVDDVAYMVAKTVSLRVFEDTGGLMNLSINDAGGQVLVVSQFTLYGDCRKGRRPSFSEAAEPGLARKLYEH